jgi:hypothetical protein
MTSTCFGKALPSSGSDWVPSELLQRQYGRRQTTERMVEPMYRRVKADSHIPCRSHAVPLSCRSAKGLDCVFPI